MAGQLDPKILIPELAQLEQQIKLVASSLLTLIESAKKLDVQFKSNKTSQAQVRDGISKLAENERILTNVDRERIAIAKKLQRTTTQVTSTQLKEGKQLVKNQVKLREVRKQARLEAEKDLGITKTRTSFFKKMTQSLMATAGAYLGIVAAIRLIKNTISTIKDFSKAMDEVAAITGATEKEFKLLENDALRLGASTSKTASQVSGLQKEFAKLGFSTKEIIDATEATISLSIAAGSDLAQSAVVAASTVRGFGLDASETQRVVDVMAKSFSSSALDLSKFQVAMGYVAPVAKSAGVSMEETTASLSVLTDAGIEASTAGTALRNMFLELSKQGLTWDEAMKKINTSTDKNKTALELFGKRGATAALVLAENTEKADKLTKSYNNAAGSAEKMAKVMEDNLEGDTKRLSSAWEGLILNFRSGEGFMRNVVQGATELVDVFSDWMRIKPSTEIENEQIQLNLLVGRLANTNLKEDERLEIINEINKNYPKFLEGLDTENLSMQDLTKRLKEYNKEFINRIILQKQQEKIESLLKKTGSTRLQIEKDTIKMEGKLAKISAQLGIEEETLGKTVYEQLFIIQKRAKEQGKIMPQLLLYQYQLTNLIKMQGMYGVMEDKAAEMTKEREEIAKRLGISLDELDSKENDLVSTGSKVIQTIQDEEESEKEKNKRIKEAITLIEQSTELAIQKEKERLMNSKLIGKEREALQEEINTNIENLEIESLNKQLAIKGLSADQEFNIQKQLFDKRFNLSQKEYQESEKLIDQQIDDIERQTEIAIYNEKKRLLESSAVGEERVILNQEVADNILAIEIENLEKLLEISEISAEERLAIEQQLLEKKLELKDQELDKEKEVSKIKKALNSEEFQVGIEIGNQLFEFGSALRDAEIQKLEEEMAYKLTLAGDNEQQREAIEEEYNRKVNQIKRKQAISDKAQAIFNAAINTAVAITKSLPNLALAILVGILGAAQIATIAAKPIPKFKHGVKNKKNSGIGIVGDAYQSELIRLPNTDNYFETPSKPTLTYLPKGSDVIPHYEKENIIQGGIQPEKFDELIREQRATRKDLRNQVRHEQNITASGYKYIVNKIKSKTEYVNKNFRV
jgi:hypothetical protein